MRQAYSIYVFTLILGLNPKETDLKVVPKKTDENFQKETTVNREGRGWNGVERGIRNGTEEKCVELTILEVSKHILLHEQTNTPELMLL